MTQEQITESVNAFLSSGRTITVLPDQPSAKTLDADRSLTGGCFGGMYEEFGISVRTEDLAEIIGEAE